MEERLDIVLASGSPRRKELLAKTGLSFRVIVSDADELSGSALPPADVAMQNAKLKALAVARDLPNSAIVIGADTIVVLDGRIFGKPVDEDDAYRMLRELSGRTHQVITGVCIARGKTSVILSEQRESKNPATGCESMRDPSTSALRAFAQDDVDKLAASAQDDERAGAQSVTCFAETTDVTFRELSDDDIVAYVSTGEPLDKAGAYGIQGGAGRFVDHIAGDYDNVVGLPVERLKRALDLERGNEVDNGQDGEQ